MKIRRSPPPSLLTSRPHLSFPLLYMFLGSIPQESLQPGLRDAYQQLTALYAEVLSDLSSSSFTDDVVYRFLVGLGTLLTVSTLTSIRIKVVPSP